jgi:hypothetical protein
MQNRALASQPELGMKAAFEAIRDLQTASSS